MVPAGLGRCGPRSGDLATPTAIRSWRLRPCSAHCHRQLVVEARQCPLQSSVGEGMAPEEEDEEKWSRALIKSNRHLAGGGKISNKNTRNIGVLSPVRGQGNTFPAQDAYSHWVLYAIVFGQVVFTIISVW